MFGVERKTANKYQTDVRNKYLYYIITNIY